MAIDARSGNLVWDTEVADYRGGYSKTAAPLIVKDQVVTGIAGGEFGIRGFLDAYDTESGEREWRTYTIPGPDHPDNRTWLGDSWRTGGSPTWITGSFTPHDVHDWDAIQIPVLADIELDDEPRQAMLWANRNGFYYTLDRATGEFLVGKPFALQTWAEGLDSTGRPIRVPGMFPSADRTVVAPTAGGATNWWSPAVSPRTGLLYVNAFDGEGQFFLRDEDYVEGERYTAGGVQSPQPMDNYRSAIRAIDPATGDVRWEFEMQPRARSGVLTTAGDLVFSATVDGYFLRPRRRDRGGALAHSPRRPRQRQPHDLRRRRRPVRHDVGGQHRLHVRPGRVAALGIGTTPRAVRSGSPGCGPVGWIGGWQERILVRQHGAAHCADNRRPVAGRERGRRQHCDRPPPVRDGHRLAVFVHLLDDTKASRLELGGSDGLLHPVASFPGTL